MKKIIAVAAAILGMALPASASTFLVGTSTGVIATVDTDTNSVVDSFDAGNQNWFDIAVDDGGNAYGMNGSGTLSSIDLVGKSAANIGSTGAFINGLAFGSGNQLFGTGGNGLYTLNLLTGAASLVGSGVSGGGTAFSSSGDIAFGGSNFFYATSTVSCNGGVGDCLWSIDATTGIGTIIGAIGFGSIYGLALTDGKLFGVSAGSSLFEIDTATGAGTLIGGYTVSGASNGSAVGPSAAIPIPAALPLLTSGLLGLGWFGRRKRKQS